MADSLGGIKGLYLFCFGEEYLCGGQPFDDVHGAMAERAGHQSGSVCCRKRGKTKDEDAERSQAGQQDRLFSPCFGTRGSPPQPLPHTTVGSLPTFWQISDDLATGRQVADLEGVAGLSTI